MHELQVPKPQLYALHCHGLLESWILFFFAILLKNIQMQSDNYWDPSRAWENTSSNQTLRKEKERHQELEHVRLQVRWLRAFEPHKFSI